MKARFQKMLLDIPLKKKVQIVVVLLAMAFIGSFSAGIFLVAKAANTNLEESALTSLSGAGNQIAQQLNTVEEISYMLLADNTVQDSLTKARLRDDDYFQYRRGFENMHNIVQYYQNQFDGNYIDYICIVNEYYTTQSASPYISTLPTDVVETLHDYASAANGAPVFVTDYINEYGLFLTREILEINDLSLSSLGFMILCIDLEGLVGDTTSWTNQYSHPDFFIFDGERLVYRSAQSKGYAIPHDFTSDSYLIEAIGDSVRFIVQKELKLTGWSCEISIPYDSINHSIKTATLLAFVVLAVVVGCVLVLSNKILDTITARVSKIHRKMQLFGDDHHNLPPSSPHIPYGKDEIGCLEEQFDNMSHQICELIEKNYVNELLRKDAELEALEKQINPHFLYNTLESVNWRAKAIGEKQISAMTEALGHLLRITLSKSTDIHTLQTELELVNSFMTIQNIRFDGLLEYEQTVDRDVETALIPKLTIQPLVENAVHYGMENGDDVCRIRLSVTLTGKELCIKVANTGSQFPEDFYNTLLQKQHSSRGFGIGLLNIDQRLRINFGAAYHIAFYNNGDWATVEIHLPFFPLKEVL